VISAIAAVIGVVIALNIIITQNFPVVKVAAPPLLTAGCTDLTATPSSLSPNPGANTFILFNCNGSAAIKVTNSGTATVTVFVNGVANPANQQSPAPGYLSLTLVPHVAGATTCNAAGTISGLPTGFSVPFGTAGGADPRAAVGSSIDYCALVIGAQATDLSAFTVQFA